MANLLFKTRFKDTVVEDPVAAGTAVKFPLTGTNEGYDWTCPGLNAQSVAIQLINNSASVTPANYTSFADKPVLITVSTTELPGYYGNAVTLGLKDTGLIGAGADVGWGGQNMLIIQRIADGTDPLPPVLDDLYMTSTFKLSADIWAGMVAGNAGKSDTTLWQFKSGGWVDPTTGLVTYKGDQRIVVQATKNAAGVIEIKCHADQNANGPTVGLPDLWEVSSSAATIDQAGYNKLEIFIHRHATAGIFKVAVNDTIVCNLTNVCTKGSLGLDIGRLFICPMYTGANLGKGVSSYAKVKAFDGIPGGSVLL